MFCRLIAAAAIVICATLPASAVNLIKPVDEALATAAGRMKVKDFSGAREAALKSSDKGARSFLLGISSLRLELWDEAASQLAIAADAYPILADYALYNQGLALSKLGRLDQAFPPLYKLLKQYPESRLARPAMILYADTLAAGGYQKEALASYLAFVERYPSGSDSISALFGSALCRDKLGDPAAAAGVLRGIWLNYPASQFAEKADREMQRVVAGTKVEPYTTAELFKRGNTLYALRRYKQAAEAYAKLPVAGQTEEFAAKLQLKTGQALFKARHYQDAQAAFRGVIQKGAGASANEATLGLGRALDKSGKPEEAFDLYLRLAEPAKGGASADDALLEAAYIKRYQRKWSEALKLFQMYLAGQPDPQKNGVVIWEAAWASYQSRDFQGAAGYFKKLADREEMREKALYWLGKTLVAAGDAKGAEAPYAALAAEYPFGYYALICNMWCDVAQFPVPPKSLGESFPMPAGFEREKALIALGLYDEAARELLSKRGKNPQGAARLYLEMGNYNGALHAMAKEMAKRGGKESASVWGVNYPLAFSEEVAKSASANGLPESLVYAIMRTESNYFPAALSPVGAVGLMQIMPATAEAISKGDSGKLTRPELNIRLGARHLKDLLVTYDRNIPLAVAAYNAGSGNVKRWQKGLAGLPQDEFIESIPFRETREYVKKVVSAMELYQRLYRLPAYKKQSL
jgi:soluble lytic murein transglycosylase